ncbi:MAG: hypothetical protein WCP31_00420 [Chloroflexales bacterium]
MSDRSFGRFLGGAFGLSLGCLLVFGLLHWLGMPSGQLVDWIIGFVGFWWLLVVVTIPWNLHFGARRVVVAAAESKRRGISVDETQVAYAQRWVNWSLLLALGLHLVSAAALYGLAAAGVSAIGYVGAVVALLLTGLRPAVAGYHYVSDRLRAIGQELLVPREDVVTLRADLRAVTERLARLEQALDPEESGSLAARHGADLRELRQSLERLRLVHDELRATNATEHSRLAREAEQAVAQISADGQVLDHVRELVRFFKSA